jgi:hypothetical protein
MGYEKNPNDPKNPNPNRPGQHDQQQRPGKDNKNQQQGGIKEKGKDW